MLVRKKAINHFVCTGPAAPAHQQDHPPRRQRQQHPVDDAWRDQTRWLWYVFLKKSNFKWMGCPKNKNTYRTLALTHIAICLSALFGCELPSFGEIGCRDVCPFSPKRPKICLRSSTMTSLCVTKFLVRTILSLNWANTANTAERVQFSDSNYLSWGLAVPQSSQSFFMFNLNKWVV